MAIDIRSNYSDMVGSAMLPMLEETFTSSYNQHPSRREMLFKVEKTDTQIWQYSEMHDMPLFSTVAESAAYTFNRAKQGSDKTISVVKYGLAANFSEELIEDSRFGHIADTVKKMGKSARESQEVAAMDIINNAFTTTLTADGLSLCNAAHTTPSGVVTIRNQLSVAADLSVSSLKEMVKDFRKNFKGDSGIVNSITPRFLVVPEELRLDAIQIVQSDLLAGTANNDVNSIKGEGLIVVASPHLTDADAWFLAADKVDNGLRIVQRKPLETRASGADYGFETDSIAYKARYREQLAAVHANGFFGTPGAV